MIKSLFLLIVTVFFLSCSGGEKSTIRITDLRMSESPEIEPASHQAGDVEIFRSNYLGDTYSIIVYREEESILKGYQAYMKATQNFKEATYQWQDENTLNFVLYSEDNGQVEKYSLMMSGGQSTLEKYD